MERKRTRNSILLAAAVILGLFSRSSVAEFLPDFIVTYAGDTLWSLALYLFLGILLPHMSVLRMAALALVLSFGVEVSQLYQADWVNAIRETRVGGLILGFGFKLSDLACYTTGMNVTWITL